MWILWTLLAVLGILLLALGIYAVTGLIFMKFAFSRSKDGGIPEALIPRKGGSEEEQMRARIIEKNRDEFRRVTEKWEKSADIEERRITAPDGTELYGRLVKAGGPSHRYFILCHGYKGTGEWMMPYAYVFEKWGWNSLVPDMRAHGKSKGKWIGMGWKDKDDVLQWILDLVSRDPDSEIVLLGVSMGGAAVMMTSGLEGLPANVKAVIDDCGYDNVWKVFREQMTATRGEGSVRMLMAGSRMNRLINGWYFQYADSIGQVRKADPDLPMLFMQGENDDFVKLPMTEEAYGAKRGLKEKVIFPDTDHGNSYVRHPEEYFAAIRKFLTEYVE